MLGTKLLEYITAAHSLESILHEEKTKIFSVDTSVVRARDVLIEERQLLKEVQTADAIILSTPLYVDTLPYPVIQIFEKLYAHREELTAKKFLFIVQNGFPEAYHNDIAVLNAKEFAYAMQWDFLGALTLGMGAAYPNFQWNKNVKKALRITAIEFPNKVPEAAQHLMRKKLMPIWLYNLVANREWKGDNLDAQPFKSQP